jgi:hypothetical protein
MVVAWLDDGETAGVRTWTDCGFPWDFGARVRRLDGFGRF